MTNQPNVNPFNIPDEEMRFESDWNVFNRKDLADQLLKIINTIPGERVILLDAPWGEGKTVFAKMCQKHYTVAGHKTIYYDVFAHDYYEQPLLPLIAKIYELIDKGKEENEAKEKAKEALHSIAKMLTLSPAVSTPKLFLIIKEFILAIKKSKSTKPLMKDLANIAKFPNTVNALFKEINESENNLNKLKEYLTALPNNIEDKYKNKPIIFIIDELDRCKPTYAIKILEIIKHLFSTPNIVFILVANSEQLCQSIKHEYGNDIDVYNYLHKFIHLRITLPKQKEHGRNIDNPKYIIDCMDKLHFQKIISNQFINEIKKRFIVFSDHYQLSFREIEKCLLTIKIMLTLLKNPDYLPTYTIAIIFIVIIKNKFPDSYLKLSNQNITYKEFIEKTKIEKGIENVNTEDGNTLAILGDLLKLHFNEDKNTLLVIRTGEEYDDEPDRIDSIITTLNNLFIS